MRIILFNILYVATCGLALARGGWPERLGAVILILDFQLSHWLIQPLGQRYHGLEQAMLAVDLAALLAFYMLALFSTRYWPLWTTALQACVVAGHMNGLRRDVIAFAYGHSVALWSYLLLALLFAGTMRHRRRRRRYGMDPSWRWQLPGDYRCGVLLDDPFSPDQLSPNRPAIWPSIHKPRVR